MPSTSLETRPVPHFHRPAERPLLRHERDRVTILILAFNSRIQDLIAAGMEGLGYQAEVLPVPSKADFQVGREFGNYGFCNPSHFVVGTLIQYLRHLRDVDGVPTEKILSDYVIVTAGACGPCRYGMYEAEFRLALRNAGFDGFRVLVFQLTRGLSQSHAGIGLELNTVFFLSLVNGILIGDLLNKLARRILPYALDRRRA